MPWVRAWVDDDISKHVDQLYLAKINAHPRDTSIAFREDDHAYFIQIEKNSWIRVKTSVSGFYANFFGNFDAESAALAVAGKRKFDRSSPYYWLMQLCEDPHDESSVAKLICEAWKLAGKRASELGTRCHAAMEHYANTLVETNGALRPSDENATWRLLNDVNARPLVASVEKWLKMRFDEGWRPYRTEWSIFIDGATTCENKDGDLFANHASVVAGQTDLLLRHTDGRFWLVDYKFCGKRKLDRELETCGKRGKAPLVDVPDNSYGHYLAQQSIYVFILKRRYDISVSRSSLLHVATDQTPVCVRLLDLDLLSDEKVCLMFKHNVKASF